MSWDVLKLLGGAGNRNRTYDLIITNDALYQLSYSGNFFLRVVATRCCGALAWGCCAVRLVKPDV